MNILNTIRVPFHPLLTVYWIKSCQFLKLQIVYELPMHWNVTAHWLLGTFSGGAMVLCNINTYETFGSHFKLQISKHIFQKLEALREEPRGLILRDMAPAKGCPSLMWSEATWTHLAYGIWLTHGYQSGFNPTSGDMQGTLLLFTL